MSRTIIWRGLPVAVSELEASINYVRARCVPHGRVQRVRVDGNDLRAVFTSARSASAFMKENDDGGVFSGSDVRFERLGSQPCVEYIVNGRSDCGYTMRALALLRSTEGVRGVFRDRQGTAAEIAIAVQPQKMTAEYSDFMIRGASIPIIFDGDRFVRGFFELDKEISAMKH
jgi:hypothetical protein